MVEIFCLLPAWQGTRRSPGEEHWQLLPCTTEVVQQMSSGDLFLVSSMPMGQGERMRQQSCRATLVKDIMSYPCNKPGYPKLYLDLFSQPGFSCIGSCVEARPAAWIDVAHWPCQQLRRWPSMQPGGDSIIMEWARIQSTTLTMTVCVALPAAWDGSRIEDWHTLTQAIPCFLASCCPALFPVCAIALGADLVWVLSSCPAYTWGWWKQHQPLLQ